MKDLKVIRHDLIFFIMGFCAMVAQILILRRTISVFGGNELVIGAVFLAWVFWAGLGNLIAGEIADTVPDAPHTLSLILNLTALFVPLTVLAASLSKVGLGLPPPALVGLPTIVGVAMVGLAPLCILIGMGLTIAAKLPATGRARDIGVMYLFDALGAAIGGLIATWLAIRAFTAFQVSLMTAILLLFFNAALLVRKTTTQILTVLLAVIGVIVLWTAPVIETWSTSVRWKGFHPIVEVDSRFGNLVVTEQGEEHTMFADGVPQFSTPLPETYETVSLLPLLEHPNPRKVLLIGGGISGMLANWKNISLEKIVYAQLDPDITHLEKAFMMPADAFSDTRLKIVHEDAIALLNSIGGSADRSERFEAIIINSGDPDTASNSRLLTREFFSKAKAALADDGVMAFGVFEPGNAIGPEAAKLLGTLKATTANVFQNLVILPFDRFYFIASQSNEYLTDDPAEIGKRIAARNISAPTLTGQYIASVFPERIRSMGKTIEDAAIASPLNTAKHPSSYYAGLMLWASRTKGWAFDFLRAAEKMKFHWIALITLVAAALSILMGRKSSHRRAFISSFWVLFAAGFASIIYELSLLVYYQMQRGFLFYRLGIIITAFMVGLSLGAYLSIRLFEKIPARSIWIIVSLLALSVYQPLLFAVSIASFVLANFICGFMAGFIYEATAEWLVGFKETVGHTAGWISCADYWGSAVGSILASIIAIPLMGLMPTLLLAAMLPAIAILVVSLLNSFR